MPVLLMIVPLAVLNMNVNIVRFLWPILSIIWLIVGYFVHKKANQEDIDASLRRTDDASYLNLLKQAGYEIYPIEKN